MKIAVKLAFDERAALRLLNWLAQENAILLRAQPDLPLLYDSGVTYRRETDETWCDYLNMLAQGHEDCDGLASARAGELIAKGWRALRPGDSGYGDAARERPASVPAEVLLTTRSTPDQPGLSPADRPSGARPGAHHALHARPAGPVPLHRSLPGRWRWHRDDPSARLGMNGGRIDPLVKERWAARAGERVEDRLMRLQPAIALDDFQDNVSGFGDWESRQARREARKSRRQQRRQDRRERRQDKKSSRQERRADRRENRQEKRTDRRENRQERRLDRVRRKQAKVREKLATTAPAPVRRALVRRPAEPSLQPAPASMSQTQRPPHEPEWLDDAWDMAENVLDAELEPEEDFEEGEDEGYDEEGYEDEAATEGIGAWRPFKRVAPALRRAATAAAAPAPNGAWGPSVRMGHKLRIQAAAGHRAAVIDLKPGLFLVAELPEAVTRTEFGLAPVLAPLMVTAARRALDEPPRERRGPLAALFRRRREEPVRYVEVQQVPQAPAAPAPLALPGPVASEPAPLVVPAPNVGWADDATVAAAYGCDRCERSRR